MKHADRPITVNLSVYVSDGSFEARMNFPLDATTEQRDGIIKSWLQAISSAVKLSEEV